tara:strand:- start:719 stop:1255 length:537 start_codon:yes stop_codon:yes gene_type:complete
MLSLLALAQAGSRAKRQATDLAEQLEGIAGSLPNVEPKPVPGSLPINVPAKEVPRPPTGGHTAHQEPVSPEEQELRTVSERMTTWYCALAANSDAAPCLIQQLQQEEEKQPADAAAASGGGKAAAARVATPETKALRAKLSEKAKAKQTMDERQRMHEAWCALAEQSATGFCARAESE